MSGFTGRARDGTLQPRCMDGDKSDKVGRALEAVRAGTRDAELAALSEVEVDDDSVSSTDLRFLAAEKVYLAGQFGDAVTRFRGFDASAVGSEVPAWQRYLSAHRQASFSWEGSLTLGPRSTTLRS